MPLAPFQLLAGRSVLWVLGLFVWSVAAHCAPNELGRPLLQNHTPGELLGGYECQAIVQDRAGVIYIANGSQLRTHDGVESWLVGPLPLESPGVSELAVTSEGTVFAVGPSLIGYVAGVGRDATFVSLADRLPASAREIGNLRHVAAVGTTVCFSDDEKLLVWHDGQFHVIPCPAPPQTHGARLYPVAQTLYVSVPGGDLLRLAGDHLEVAVAGPVVRSNTLVTVVPGATAGTRVLLTAEHGFYQADAAGHVERLPIDANRWLEGKRIFRALRLANGGWVVGFSSVSGDGGMRFAPDGTYEGPVDMSIGLIVKTLRWFFPDQEGGLLVGTEMGFSRVAWPSGTTLFDTLNGLGDGTVVGVVRHEGALFVAANAGLFRLVPADAAGRAAHFKLVLAQPLVALGSSGNDLLALGENALYVSSPSGFTTVFKLPARAHAFAVSKRDPRHVWVATDRGLEALHRGEAGWLTDGLVAGLDGPCDAVMETADGALWTAADGPVVIRHTPGEIRRFTAANGLPAGARISALTQWNGAPLVLFANDKVPCVFQALPQRFAALAQATSADDAAAVAADPAPAGTERLWLGGATSFRRLGPGAPFVFPHEIVAAIGGVSWLYPESGPEGDVVWVGGEKGLARVESARAMVPPVPLRVQLRAVNVTAGQRLDPEHAPVTFGYFAPRFAYGAAVNYETRLVGHERTWMPWSPLRERTFPHLPAGDYRFEVRARDDDGVISAPAEMAFTVLAPWWMTRWAVGAYIAVAGLVIFGAVQLRTRALQQRAARLERIVAERTAELAEKNVELTRLHRLESEEKIAARLAEEKARLEVLRYQLNPHFLFNTLASISGSLPPGRSSARAMVERLAEFCRLTLHRSDEREWTTLGDEMRLIEAYLAIEKSRWEDMLTVEIEADPALLRERLPYFLLLPLVENALKYGRATSVDRVGIRISARRHAAPGSLVIAVANTGEWIEPTAPRRVSTLGIGLENLRERLGRYYPRAHTFSFSHGDGWVTATLVLTAESVPAAV